MQRTVVLSALASALALVREYDQSAALLGESPIGPTVDLDPATVIPAQPIAGRDGIVSGSLREDGSVELEGWNRAVAESATSPDKWHQAWAAQKNRIDRFFIPDALNLPGLTDRQKLNIDANCEHASAKFTLYGTDPRDTAIDRKARCWFGYEMERNESGLGREVSVIPDVGAFGASDGAGTRPIPGEAYQYAISARRKWIEAQPLWVSETTGIYYGQNGKR